GHLFDAMNQADSRGPLRPFTSPPPPGAIPAPPPKPLTADEPEAAVAQAQDALEQLASAVESISTHRAPAEAPPAAQPDRRTIETESPSLTEAFTSATGAFEPASVHPHTDHFDDRLVACTAPASLMAEEYR